MHYSTFKYYMRSFWDKYIHIDSTYTMYIVYSKYSSNKKHYKYLDNEYSVVP